MIDVYGMESPNAVKIYIALEEMGLPYRNHFVDVLHNENYEPWFTALNPVRKVPVIVDEDGPDGTPFTLFESGAILLYLAEKTGKLIPADKAGRYITVQWVFQQHGLMGPMGGQLAHFLRFAPDCKDPYPEQRYRTQNNILYDLYDGELAKRPYIAGDEFTIADCAIWPWICYHELHQLDLDARKHLRAWFDKVGERPAVRKVTEMIGKLKSTAGVMGSMTEDHQDLFFARGKHVRA